MKWLNRRGAWTLGMLLLWMTNSAFAAAPVEFTPPGQHERCTVCGMFVSAYSSWWAAVVLSDESTLYFDGPKDMFAYLADRSTYHQGQPLPEIKAIFVTDYYTGQPRLAREVFFVIGSDVLGPMGKELVPVAGEQALKTYLHDHGGDKVEIYRNGELEEIPVP